MPLAQVQPVDTPILAVEESIGQFAVGRVIPPVDLDCVAACRDYPLAEIQRRMAAGRALPRYVAYDAFAVVGQEGLKFLRGKQFLAHLNEGAAYDFAGG